MKKWYIAVFVLNNLIASDHVSKKYHSVQTPYSRSYTCCFCKKEITGRKHLEIHKKLHFAHNHTQAQSHSSHCDKPYTCILGNVQDRQYFRCTECFSNPDELHHHTITHFTPREVYKIFLEATRYK